MEGEDPYPCACDSAWGGPSRVWPTVVQWSQNTYIPTSTLSLFSLSCGVVYVFTQFSRFFFFGCTCDPVDFFFLFFWVFGSLGLCVFGRMTYAVTSMLSPSIEKPGTRVLAFRVAAHHVCISGFGFRGKLRFLTGYTTSTTYTLPYNVLSTL